VRHQPRSCIWRFYSENEREVKSLYPRLKEIGVDSVVGSAAKFCASFNAFTWSSNNANRFSGRSERVPSFVEYSVGLISRSCCFLQREKVMESVF
jgi:hypothetical protein